MVTNPAAPWYFFPSSGIETIPANYKRENLFIVINLNLSIKYDHAIDGLDVNLIKKHMQGLEAYSCTSCLYSAK